MPDVGSLINSVGFPAAVAVFLLYRDFRNADKRIEQYHEALTANTSVIKEMTAALNNLTNSINGIASK